jgi:hypothetical protein
LLVDHRERLVRQRVALNNTLQWHLHDIWPELRLPGSERSDEPCAVRRAWLLADRSVQLTSSRTLFVRSCESDGSRGVGATRARRAPGGCRRRRSTRPA